MADDAILDICPHCGAFLIEETDTCPSCNKPLNDGGVLVPEDDDSGIQCSVCGSFVDKGLDICPKCDAPIVDDGKPEIDLDPDEFEGFLDFLVDDERIIEGEEIDSPIIRAGLDELDNDAKDAKKVTPMDDFFDDIQLSEGPDEGPVEKPDVREEVQKTVIVESLSGRVDDEVRFDEIEPDDVVRLCANCGGLVTSSATECTVCGEELTPENLLIPHNVKKDILEKMPIKEAEDVMKKALGIVEDWVAGDIEAPEEFTDTIICTNCGAFVPGEATECQTCGTEISEMPEMDIAPPSDEFSINVCSRCGAFLNEDTSACNVCGLEVADAGPEISTPVPEPAYDDKKAEGIFKTLLGVSEIEEIEDKEGPGGEIGLCPDCGAFVSPDAVVCSVCNTSLVEGDDEQADIDFNLEEEIAELSESTCPNCDSKLPAGISDCEVCGFSFFDKEPAVKELEEMESVEGIDLATDIIDNLDIQIPAIEAAEGEEKASLEDEYEPEEDEDDLGIDELLIYSEPEDEEEILDEMEIDEEDDDFGEDDVSDEEFKSLLDDIDETIQKESGKTADGKIEIQLEERLALLKKAFETGAISKDLYRRNLEVFLDDLVVVEELVERVDNPDDDGLPTIMPPVERLAKLKKAFEDGVIDKETYRHNLQNLMAELEGKAGFKKDEDVPPAEEEPASEPSSTGPEPEPQPAPEEQVAEEGPVPDDETPEDVEYIEEAVEEIPPVNYDEEDDVFDDGEAIMEKLADGSERTRFNLSTWDYGIYASLVTSIIYLTFKWIIPGDYSISLAVIFGVILLAGIYLIINCRGAFYKKDVVRGVPFMLGGFIISFILIHWYMGSLNSEIGAFQQPRFDRILLSAGILLIGIGIIWVRSRVRYIFMWITGTTLLFLFALGKLIYFERWEYAPVQPPGALIFGVGVTMVFFSTFLLAYEKSIENSIESDIVRGDISYLRRDYKTALDSYDSALMKTSDEISREEGRGVPMNYDVPWYSKGAALILMGELEEGIKCMDMALAINPKNEMAWTNKGNALSRLGNYEGAMECYEKAIEANPRYIIAFNNMGNALARSKDYVQALNYYNKAIKLNPEYQDAWINKGYVLAKMGKNDMAMKCIDMVTKKQAELAAPPPGSKAAKALG